MSATAIAAASVLLAFAAVWELAGGLEARVAERGRELLIRATGGRLRGIADTASRLGIGERIRLAGLEGRLQPATVIWAKGGGVGLGALLATLAAPALPGRLALAAAALLVAAGFLAPDAALDRRARRRRAQLVAALPDALELLAVATASGRSPGAVLGEISLGTTGPLAAELAISVAEIECGASEGRAFETLRERVPGVEVGTLASALERSRRYGSPLAEQLGGQAEGLRREEHRRIEERAARAAPKIQLVVALVLVPSVLLAIAATIIAHSDALLGAF